MLSEYQKAMVHFANLFDKGQETTSSMKPEEQNFLDAMVKLYKDEESTDAYLVCQGIRKPVHKAVLVAR